MIYLDHAAATPVDPKVWKAMLPYFAERFANPSSIYQFALGNRQAIDDARKRVADILGCKPGEVYFTGGGTESNNWAIFGATATCHHRADGAGATAELKRRAIPKQGGPTCRGKHGHLVTSVIEHHSVLGPMEELERGGCEVTYLPVDDHGHVDMEKLKNAINEETTLVSIAYANNEIGTIENIGEIALFLNTQGVLFHTDACQAAGSLPLDVATLGVDLMTLNGGKIYGPKGSGILYIKDGVKIAPLLYGGGQEHRQRAGTENVPGIIGFAEALEIADSMRQKESARLVKLRDELIHSLQKLVPGTKLNGDPVNRLPNNINVSFDGIDAESLLLRLDMEGICASAGSACTSGALEPSHVLMALGIEKDLAKSSIRMTLGRENTDNDIRKILEVLPPIVQDLRKHRKPGKKQCCPGNLC